MGAHIVLLLTWNLFSIARDTLLSTVNLVKVGSFSLTRCAIRRFVLSQVSDMVVVVIFLLREMLRLDGG